MDLANSLEKNILSKGNSIDPELAYVKFRGKLPKVDALLKGRGLVWLRISYKPGTCWAKNEKSSAPVLGTGISKNFPFDALVSEGINCLVNSGSLIVTG